MSNKISSLEIRWVGAQGRSDDTDRRLRAAFNLILNAARNGAAQAGPGGRTPDGGECLRIEEGLEHGE